MKKKSYRPSIFELGFHIFDKWMKLKYEGKSLQKYFDDNCISREIISASVFPSRSHSISKKN